jgi:Protein of unknown function (DUF3710)
VAFGRRRQAEDPAKGSEPTDEETGVDPAEEDDVDEAPVTTSDDGGPWDSEEEYPELQRLDFGSLQIPVAQGLAFTMNLEASQFDEEGNALDAVPTGVIIQYEQSAMQVRALAAPKRSGIWDDIRRDFTREVTEDAGGQTQDQEGPFGREVLAMVPLVLNDEVLSSMPQEVREQLPAEFVEQGWAPRVMRFIGVDGPRWFLQAVVEGAAVEDEEQFQFLEDVFRNIVVVRGESPMPPRDLLPLTVPEEFNEAAEQAEEGEKAETFDPFERGPEITEVR